MDVRLPDGTVLRGVPDGTTKADIVAKLKANGREVPADWLTAAPPPPPAAASVGDTIRQTGRQVGLTARYALEGAPRIIEPVTEPLRHLVNRGARAVGLPEGDASAGQLGTRLADLVGLPKPQGANEEAVAEGTRTGFSAIGGVAAARQVASRAMQGGTTQAVAKTAATAPGAQTLAATAGGGAGATVREAGGGDVEQFAAALAAGLAAPFAAMGVQGAGGNVARQARKFNPERVDAVLKAELGKAGVDWAALPGQARQALRNDAKDAIYSGQPLNPESLMRLAAYRRTGATPLVGDITQTPGDITRQRNLAKQAANSKIAFGASDLPELQNENARAVLRKIDNLATSPLDEHATGERVISAVRGRDDALKAQEDALYKQAREAAGRDFALDRRGFVDQAFGNLARSNKMAFLPAEVGELLNQISAGTIKRNGQEFAVPFTVDTIDSLKTTLASASRAAKDGNVKAALKAVRDALEDTKPQVQAPSLNTGGTMVTGQQAAAMRTGEELPAQALELFDKARAAARGRREWQESSKVVAAALDDGTAPDSFVKRFVINGSVDDLRALQAEIGGGTPSAGRSLTATPGAGGAPAPQQAELLNAVRRRIVDYVLQRGGADPTRPLDIVSPSGKGLDDALRQIGRRKLAMFFTPDEIADLRAAADTMRYSQAQPTGSAVNNSNSGALLLGKLADLARPIPVIGPMAGEPLQGLSLSLQARPVRDVGRALTAPAPGAPRQPSGGAGSSLVPLSALLAPTANARNDERRERRP